MPINGDARKRGGGTIAKYEWDGNMDELISPKELSKLLKVSKPWPYLMAKKGILPCYKLGTAVRFKRSDIEDYLNRCRLEGKRSRIIKENS